MSRTMQSDKQPPRELRVCRALRLLAGGQSEQAVAAEVRVTQETIDKWQQDDDFQDLLACMRENGRLHEVLRRLDALSIKAVAALEDKLQNSEDRIVVQVARDVLDRVGAIKGAGARLDQMSEQVIRVEYGTDDGTAYTPAPWAERHPAASGTLQGAGDGAALREDGDGQDSAD